MADWRPIKTAPRDGTRILALDQSGLVVIARWSLPHRVASGYRWKADGNIIMRPDPTHWMPLPNRPIEAKDDGDSER